MKLIENGFFIVFEGCDGSGKTSVSQAVWRKLQEDGFSVEWTREPGGTPSGKVIRELLVKNDSDVSPKAELLLYAADRAQHLDTKIKPRLEEGLIVISDRYYQSTMAFQGGGRGHDKHTLLMLQDLAGTVEPDITFILDAPTSVTQKRILKGVELCSEKASEQKFENIGHDFSARARDVYLEAEPHFPAHHKSRVPRYIHVDNSGNTALDGVVAYIVQEVKEHLFPFIQYPLPKDPQECA